MLPKLCPKCYLLCYIERVDLWTCFNGKGGDAEWGSIPVLLGMKHPTPFPMPGECRPPALLLLLGVRLAKPVPSLSAAHFSSCLPGMILFSRAKQSPFAHVLIGYPRCTVRIWLEKQSAPLWVPLSPNCLGFFQQSWVHHILFFWIRMIYERKGCGFICIPL